MRFLVALILLELAALTLPLDSSFSFSLSVRIVRSGLVSFFITLKSSLGGGVDFDYYAATASN